MKSTRLSFRPRPLDLNKQLDIVRDSKDLDNQDGNVSREITHNHEGLDAENEAVMPSSGPRAYLACFSAALQISVVLTGRGMPSAGPHGAEQEGQRREGDPDP